jgi:Adenine specific DNA methylase Mod
MALLQDLIQQIEDPALKERILQETNKLLKQKKFGLVFEEHLPECTPLYDVPIRVGSKVALKTGYVSDIYTVMKIDGDEVLCDRRETHEQKNFKLDKIVAIAEFGEPIYPTLKQLDAVENAPGSDLWHTLIKADNYHALQLLEYLYAEKVDCIYIDPPYNTGAKDWKYNNDYVDSSDAYRHSKWLSMMEKRLKIAKKLLNPKNSVMVVTIDEKEYLHLGCLLEELFPEARIQMVTSIINRKGVSHKGNRSGTSKKEITQFSRVAEYLYFVMFGDASIRKAEHNMLDSQDAEEESAGVDEKVSWLSMLRRGAASHRADKPKHFYPIFVEHDSATIIDVGEPLELTTDRKTVSADSGIDIVWPMHTDGSEGRWQLKRETFIAALEEGAAKLGTYNKRRKRWAINYLNQGTKDDIAKGAITIEGRDEKGALILKRVSEKLVEPKSVWNQTSHNASEYGTTLLNAIIGSERFSYPKSLYAVKDTIDMCVHDKPDALIVDFFAGSGTTLHAVNLLNAKTNGRRRCIMVTNNEVSVETSEKLSQDGYKPGDDEWEKYGIAHNATWPRTVCSIEGHDINGTALIGDYLGSTCSMSSGFPTNAAFFKLSFLDKTSVALGRQFRELLPVLWMKGGAIGKCPTLGGDELPEMLILPQNKMAILIDEIYYSEFDAELSLHPKIQTVFIVTDSETAYRSMIRTYDGKACYQLYRDYLDNFRINTGR